MEGCLESTRPYRATLTPARPPDTEVSRWTAWNQLNALHSNIALALAPHTCLVWETSFKTHTDTIHSTGVIRPTATPFTGSQWYCSTGYSWLQALHSRRPNPLLAKPIGRNRSTLRATNSVVSQTQTRIVGRPLVNQPISPHRGGTYLWGFTLETHMSKLR